MTKLLEQAIAKAQKLSDEEQDALALTMFAMTEGDTPLAPLDDAARAAIEESFEQAQRDKFVSDEQISALWKRHGL